MKLAAPFSPETLPLASMKLAAARYYGARASLRVGLICDKMVMLGQGSFV